LAVGIDEHPADVGAQQRAGGGDVPVAGGYDRGALLGVGEDVTGVVVVLEKLDGLGRIGSGVAGIDGPVN
jgi:hypothetical protein